MCVSFFGNSDIFVTWEYAANIERLHSDSSPLHFSDQPVFADMSLLEIYLSALYLVITICMLCSRSIVDVVQCFIVIVSAADSWLHVPCRTSQLTTALIGLMRCLLASYMFIKLPMLYEWLDDAHRIVKFTQGNLLSTRLSVDKTSVMGNYQTAFSVSKLHSHIAI